jgi:hypothetical protein
MVTKWLIAGLRRLRGQNLIEQQNMRGELLGE